MVVLATIVAILCTPIPMSPLNTAFAAAHIAEAVESEHETQALRNIEAHNDDGLAGQAHHNPADHSHDVPNGIVVTTSAPTSESSGWTPSATPSGIGRPVASIERPPRSIPLA